MPENVAFKNAVLIGDCVDVMAKLPDNIVSVCITDPPYNYEFIGHKWDHNEILRRKEKISSSNSKTLVKNIPYGSGLAGGVRNKRWYERNRENIIDYRNWCLSWATELFRISKPGATIAIFNSTRTIAHIQIALEDAGFYARDTLVYRRSSGIPKGANIANQMRKRGISNADAWAGWHSCFRGEWEAICIVQKPLIGNYLDTFEKYGTGLFNTTTTDGSFQSNILEGLGREKLEDFNVHCTVKPLKLMERLVEMLVPPTPNALLIDPFAGSGTTLVASKKLGIDFLGIEIVEEYHDIIMKRLANYA
ncbi:MAG: site-specific DNA-methyltransferase [Brucellaceae bacterium]|jgi:site-specific DNA-methyltransferase (adenine-specific)|nr:site-specific DNA-methyltransferase [Brucellaceae bacterium]